VLRSFDPVTREEIDEAWLRESERRLAAYERGEIKAFSADEVLSKLKTRVAT